MPKATKKHRSNREWIERHINDPFVKKSRQEGYRARSVYKLTELDDKERLLKPGITVVDLGAAPGSWTQIVCERLRDKAGQMRGKVIAMDILPMDPLPGVDFIQGDFREQAVADQLAALLGGEKVDVVLSDMSPNLSGVSAADAARSALLNELALEFVLAHLKPEGAFVTKAFQGSGYSQFVEALKRHFKAVATRKPAASRDTSAETYLVARGLKDGAGAPPPLAG
ncbi:MAG: ribosomal large subunit methyltransferase [Pseudomonadota bacterium]|jgi:23S rRNA (uridine2552-2'-O)-methyltransferase